MWAAPTTLQPLEVVLLRGLNGWRSKRTPDSPLSVRKMYSPNPPNKTLYLVHLLP